ncbi:hypothetical protein CRYUN_Cryun09bG0157900 [Craigia yunnanensis]
MKTMKVVVAFILTFSLLSFSSLGFQSDELLVDDEEFGLEGAPKPRYPEPIPTRSTPVTTPTRKRHSDLDSDSKIQFSLDHAFGDSDFSPAGTFSARLKTWSHGGQTLTKLRFSRNNFTDEEKEKFKNLLESDDFYRIRLPSNVLSPPGRDFIISSVKARCLPRVGLDEHFVIHMEGINVLAVNYGSPGSCPYPRNLKLWMYLIPLGLIVMNAITQAMNMPEEQATGQVPAQGQPSAGAVQRGPSSTVRRR